MKNVIKIQLPVELKTYTASIENVGEDVKLPAVLWQLLETLSMTSMVPEEIGAYLSLDSGPALQVIEELVASGLITESEGHSYSEWKDMYEEQSIAVEEDLLVLDEETLIESEVETSSLGDGSFEVEESTCEVVEVVSFNIA
ncbi:hypothetical protein [Rubritalea sp.]|uniref:hypothetical protein n=1 Tax=Rubritalea sp. TaxID=2109375 RepID=UPI003EF9246B